jgi:predicted nucleic acid-binding protein
MARPIVVDAGPFLAMVSRKDDHHQAVVAWLETVATRDLLVPSPYAASSSTGRSSSTNAHLRRTLTSRHKKPFFDREPMPRISVVGERLAELLRATR